MTNHAAAVLGVHDPAEQRGRDEFPRRATELTLAAAAGVALAGALAHWVFGVELGLGASALVAAGGAVLSVLTGFTSFL